MIDPELAKRWKVTESFLEQARKILSENINQSGQTIADQSSSGLADFEKYCGVNELELALDELEALGEINLQACPAGFWRWLERAALSMGLHDRAAKLNGTFHAVLGSSSEESL